MWNSWHSFLSKIKFFTYFSSQALNGEDIPPPLWQLIFKGLKRNHKPKNTDGKTCAWIRMLALQWSASPWGSLKYSVALNN